MTVNLQICAMDFSNVEDEQNPHYQSGDVIKLWLSGKVGSDKIAPQATAKSRNTSLYKSVVIHCSKSLRFLL